MDIQRDIQPRPLWRRYWAVAPIALLVIGVVLVRQMVGDASHIIQKDQIQTATVERGNFQVDVRGVGVLKPKDLRWVSSQVTGRAEEVWVKPGAEVREGQALMRLSNPELHRELEKARWELEARRAEGHAARVMLESQMVDLQNSVVEAEFEYLSTKLKLDAETELLEKKGALISRLDYERSKLSVAQQHQRWLAQQQRVVKMQANIEASETALQARLGQVENNYQRIGDQVDNLTVTSTTEGVVQQVSLALGQHATSGASVALIASQQSLIAELQVQELQIRDIVVGQPVIIDTRSSQIRGQVIRIAPGVTAGMVQVDVELLDALPSEARPDLNVEGKIQISNIQDALYVRRPAFAPRYTSSNLYRLSTDEKFAEKTLVELGQSSVNLIQIVSGLAAGDTIIISDTSAWQQHANVLIN